MIGGTSFRGCSTWYLYHLWSGSFMDNLPKIYKNSVVVNYECANEIGYNNGKFGNWLDILKESRYVSGFMTKSFMWWHIYYWWDIDIAWYSWMEWDITSKQM